MSTEVSVVVEDFSASGGQELSIQRGQTVEVLESSTPNNLPPDFCLVRTLSTEGGLPHEGLVPMAALKQVPNVKVSGSRTSIDQEGKNDL